MPRCAGFTVVLFVILGFSWGCGRRPPPRGTAESVSEIKADPARTPSATPTDAIQSTDWPGWRGIHGDGLAPDQSIPVQWSAIQNVIWSTKLPGRGHASPTIVGDQVYLATADEKTQEQLVVAIDRATGKQNWKTSIHRGGLPSEVHQKATHANSTVACDGKYVFGTFLHRDKIWVTALDLNGKQVWQREAGPFSSKFGYAPSPILHGADLIVAGDNWGGGWVAAIDRSNGEVVWRRNRPAVSTYSSPRIATIAGREQLLLSGCNQVVSFNPDTGETLWEAEGTAEATCGTLVTDGERVFASGGYPERQTLCISGNGSGKVLWENRTKIYEPSMIVVDQYLYAVSDEGIAYCWSAETGKQAWQKRVGGSFSASPVACNGMVFIPNLEGETIVFQASPKAYQEVARNKLGEETLASFAICGDRLFIRTASGRDTQRTETLYCIGNP